MTLADNVNIDDYVMAKDDLSGADIKVCSLILGFLTVFLHDFHENDYTVEGLGISFESSVTPLYMLTLMCASIYSF